MIALTLYVSVLASLGVLAVFTRFARYPVYWILAPWLIAFAPIWFGVIHYSQPPVGLEVLIFVSGHLIFIGAGYGLMRFYNKKYTMISSRSTSAPIRSKEFYRLAPIIDGIAVLGALGALLFCIDAIIVTGFVSSNAVEQRANFLDKDKSVFGQLAPMLGWGSYVALLALFWFGREILLRRTTFYFASAATVTLFSILSAGRQSLFLFLIFGFIGWILTQSPLSLSRMSLKRLLAASLSLSIAATIIWQMLTLTGERTADSIDDKLGYFLYIFNAQLNLEIEQLLRSISGDIATGLIGGLLYFSSQLSSLAAFLNIEASDTWGIGGGAFQFPWIYRRLEIFGVTPLPEVMQMRRDYLSAQGYMSVSWSTTLATFLNDFGYVGSYIYSLIVGLTGGYVYRNYVRRQTFFAFVTLVGSYVYLFYLIIMPASFESLFFFLVVGAFALDRSLVHVSKGEVSIRRVTLKRAR